MRTAANPVGFAGTAEESYMQRRPKSTPAPIPATRQVGDISPLFLSPNPGHPSLHTAANPVGFAGTLKETAMQPETTPARDRLIKLPEAESLSGLKKSTIYSKIKEGTFPRPVRLSSRAVAFSESAVLRWVQARIQAGGNT